MSFAYGYARVSHQNQLAGDSKAAQARRAEQYFQSHLEEHGVQWAFVVDEADSVSAYRVPFKSRKGGAKLLQLLRPGDHVIFDKIDRVWRSSRDFAELHQWFLDNQVTFHITNMMGCSLASNSPMGDFMLRLMVSIAELESATISSRIKGAFKHERESGFWTARDNKISLPGLKVVEAVPRVLNKKGQPKRMLTWDQTTRLINQRIVNLRDNDLQVMPDRDASFKISDIIHADHGDGKQYRYRESRFWNPTRCRLAYMLEKHIYPTIIEPRYADLKELFRLRDNCK